jgi:hypothetical protein
MTGAAVLPASAGVVIHVSPGYHHHHHNYHHHWRWICHWRHHHKACYRAWVRW